jgi:hypothetical protein
MIERMLLMAVLYPLLVAQATTGGTKNPGPLASLTASFPGSLKYKNHGKVLEFCPDNTCHGFSASKNVPRVELEDFAFLYIYYYSDYYALPEWRTKEQVTKTADQLLSKPSYRQCQKGTARESARCILLNLSSKGKIRLLFIRYDEGKRNVVPEDIREEVTEKGSPPQ